jgi:hypothetical protein
MEQLANAQFQQYAKLYFDYCLSSVYFFDVQFEGFGTCWLVKKCKNSKTKYFRDQR